MSTSHFSSSPGRFPDSGEAEEVVLGCRFSVLMSDVVVRVLTPQIVSLLCLEEVLWPFEYHRLDSARAKR